MQCPNCKTHTLVKGSIEDPIKGKLEGYKCITCTRFFKLDDTSHLKPVASQAAPMTHTAALLKPAPVKPETMTKAVEIAKKSLKLKSGPIEESLHAEVLRRCAMDEKPAKIAADIGYEVQSVYNFKSNHRRTIAQEANKQFLKELTTPEPKGAALYLSKEVPKPQPIEPKKNGHKQVYNNTQGNIMSQMARLSRGEIKPASARPVLTRYKEMLEGTLKAKQSEVKELKTKISVTDEALRELDVIQQGEKAVVEKVLASVR